MATDREKKVENLGKRLKELRDEQGLTQEEVANAIGVEAGAYSNYERETRTPDVQKLTALADFYRVTIDYLCGRTTQRTGGNPMDMYGARLFRDLKKVIDKYEKLIKANQDNCQ